MSNQEFQDYLGGLKRKWDRPQQPPQGHAPYLNAWRMMSPINRNLIAPVPKAVKSADGRWYWVECDQPLSITYEQTR